MIQKYPFIPARNFSFICSKILHKDFLMKPRVRRFSTKQIKCRYLHKINEKSRAGINGYFCIKKPLLWEWHFHKLLCEEMIFQLPSGKNREWKYHFFTQKFVEMPHLPSYQYLGTKMEDSRGWLLCGLWRIRTQPQTQKIFCDW